MSPCPYIAHMDDNEDAKTLAFFRLEEITEEATSVLDADSAE